MPIFCDLFGIFVLRRLRRECLTVGSSGYERSKPMRHQRQRRSSADRRDRDRP